MEKGEVVKMNSGRDDSSGALQNHAPAETETWDLTRRCEPNIRIHAIYQTHPDEDHTDAMSRFLKEPRPVTQHVDVFVDQDGEHHFQVHIGGHDSPVKQLSLFDDEPPFGTSFSAPLQAPVIQPRRPEPRTEKITGIFSIFMSKQSCNSFIGDLEERFRLMLNEKGRRAATLWFWREIRHSFLSLTLDGLKKLSGLEKLMERYRRIGS